MKTFGWILAASLVLVGCASKPDPVGSYTANPPGSTSPASLEVKADKTFAMSVPAAQMTATMDGKWTFAEGTLTLTYENMNGQPVAKLLEMAKAMGQEVPAQQSQTATLQSDNSLLFAMAGQQIVFKRK